MNHLKIEYHMTDDQLLRMRGRAAAPEEMDRWMEHIAECDMCAQRMAEIFEEGPMLEVTPLFCESVWREIEQTSEERQIVAVSKDREILAQERIAVKQEYTPRVFRSYPFKVVLAACVTLILMNVGIFGTYVGGDDSRSNDLLSKSIKPLERISREWRDTSQRWADIMEGEITL